MKQSKEKLISKNLGIGNAGQLSLTAKTDKFGYCPGEAISLFSKYFIVHSFFLESNSSTILFFQTNFLCACYN